MASVAKEAMLSFGNNYVLPLGFLEKGGKMDNTFVSKDWLDLTPNGAAIAEKAVHVTFSTGITAVEYINANAEDGEERQNGAFGAAWVVDGMICTDIRPYGRGTRRPDADREPEDAGVNYINIVFTKLMEALETGKDFRQNISPEFCRKGELGIAGAQVMHRDGRPYMALAYSGFPTVSDDTLVVNAMMNLFSNEWIYLRGGASADLYTGVFCVD